MIIRFLIEKEFKQMMRNIILPVVFILLPFGMINIIPRAATQEVKNLKISIVDNDRSTLSARLIQKLSASSYFTVTRILPTYNKAMTDIESGDSDFIIEIEQNFERDLFVEGKTHIMISANAVNGVKAGLGSSYLAQIISDYSDEIKKESSMMSGNTSNYGYEIFPRYLFNTELNYQTFMIPGLIAMLLILIVGFLPALNIVSEKEKGTIEQINVTPVGRFDFIFSKLVPYWCVGLFILTYSMFLSWKIFGLVPAGNIGLIYLFSSLFILVVSCLGLIVSNYSDTTQQAALVMFFFLVIFILMSGLLTPIAGMPQWAKAITTINPLRYFIEAMRMLYLKGSSFTDLIPNFRALVIYAVTVWGWAIFSYRKNS